MSSYQNFKFLNQEQNNNQTTILNPHVNNLQNNNNTYKEYFDSTVSNYGQSNSDYFNIQNNIPKNTDFNTNGRVVFDIKKPVIKHDLFEGQKNVSISNNPNNSLNYGQETSELSNTYFSKNNITILQMMIRQEVFKRCEMDTDPILTNHKPVNISNQDETTLKIIMRSIYLQYSKNSPVNIQSQINDLNTVVVSECVPDIIINLKQYIGYIADIQRLPNPMDHPSYVSSKGEKTFSLIV